MKKVTFFIIIIFFAANLNGCCIRKNHQINQLTDDITKLLNDTKLIKLICENRQEPINLIHAIYTLPTFIIVFSNNIDIAGDIFNECSKTITLNEKIFRANLKKFIKNKKFPELKEKTSCIIL